MRIYPALNLLVTFFVTSCMLFLHFSVFRFIRHHWNRHTPAIPAVIGPTEFQQRIKELEARTRTLLFSPEDGVVEPAGELEVLKAINTDD